VLPCTVTLSKRASLTPGARTFPNGGRMKSRSLPRGLASRASWRWNIARRRNAAASSSFPWLRRSWYRAIRFMLSVSDVQSTWREKTNLYSTFVFLLVIISLTLNYQDSGRLKCKHHNPQIQMNRQPDAWPGNIMPMLPIVGSGGTISWYIVHSTSCTVQLTPTITNGNLTLLYTINNLCKLKLIQY